MRGRPSRRKRALELVGDGPVVLLVEVLDVALEARLRPPALIVPSGSLLGPVGDLLAAGPAAVPVGGPARARRRRRARRHRVRRAARAARAEVVGDPDRVRNRRRQRAARSRRCRARGEDGEPVRAVTVELAVEITLEPLEVGLQTLPGLVRQGRGRLAPCDFAPASSSERTRVAASPAVGTTLGSRSR